MTCRYPFPKPSRKCDVTEVDCDLRGQKAKVEVQWAGSQCGLGTSPSSDVGLGTYGDLLYSTTTKRSGNESFERDVDGYGGALCPCLSARRYY